MMTILSILIAISFLLSCEPQNQPAPVRMVQVHDGYQSKMQDINKILIKKDEERVEAYAARMNWDLERTESGLQYRIIEQHGNDAARNHSIVEINHRTELLDGTLLYEGRRWLQIGRTDSEAGLQEGLKMLGTGDSAIFISPPYLGKGLLGDFEKVPARSVLVYKLKVKSIENF